MNDLRFAVIGTGFWSSFQLAAWNELKGARCVALCNRTRQRAEKLALQFNVPAIYDDPEEMLAREEPDFIDIITDVKSHAQLVRLAASRRVAVICQKPMASSLEESQLMVQTCREAAVPFFIHENWRWQNPLRQLEKVLSAKHVGTPFRARIRFCSSFPVFDNQPSLKELEQFILTDIGSHILDAARFLFGEAESVYCQIQRINPGIKGEDVATVIMKMRSGMTVVCEMSYASRTRDERFPETFVFVECDAGSVELGPDYCISVTDKTGTQSKRWPPHDYLWADPAYALVHASIVPCNENLLSALRGEGCAETTGEDNLRTMEIVFASYQSALSGKVVTLSELPRR